MLQALQHWIKGQIVPGANKTIDDLTMLSFLQKWIKGTPMSSASKASTVLSVQSVQMAALSSGGHELRVRGQNVASVSVQVFDLRGRLMLREENAGSTVRFALTDRAGAPLANGVYLYVVTVEGRWGERWRSEVKKFVALK